MKKILIIIIGALAIFAGYWFISPLFTEKVVDEAIPFSNPAPVAQMKKDSTSTPVVPDVQTVASGSFTGFDRLHNGSGTAKIITVGGKHFIRFEDDFSVTNGPDLYVGLGANGEYMKGSELGVLKGNKGSQNYELPAGVNPEDIKEVWVWCKAFSVPFARAVLQ